MTTDFGDKATAPGAGAVAGRDLSRSRVAEVHVTALVHMEGLIEQTGARYLVTTINSQMIPRTPTGIRPEHHLRLGFNDITAPSAGMTPPSVDHVQQIIEFAERWRHDGPLVIHCLAGISRSTATAYIVLCALNPDISEVLIASRIRQASETADPNIRLVSLADRLLGREGRMLRAIKELEPKPFVCEAALPFFVPSLLSADEGR